MTELASLTRRFHPILTRAASCARYLAGPASGYSLLTKIRCSTPDSRLYKEQHMLMRHYVNSATSNLLRNTGVLIVPTL
jgi:hypothetical protein